MAVAGCDEQIAILARQGPQRRCVWIEQGPQDRRKSRFSRTLFARQHDHRIGTVIAQAGERPGDHKHEIGVGPHVEERSQRRDRSAAHRDRHRLHARSAAKTDGWVVDDAPAVGVDLHRPPCFITEVEIEQPIEPADTDMDLPFRASKCALASITFSADCSASEFGAPPVLSKKRRVSQRRKPSERIGHVFRWPPMWRSANPIPAAVWNSSADCAISIKMSACLGRAPPTSPPLAATMASSSAVTRQPAFFRFERDTSKAAGSTFLSAVGRSSISGAKAAPALVAVRAASPSKGSLKSSAASIAAAIRSIPSPSFGVSADA